MVFNFKDSLEKNVPCYVCTIEEMVPSEPEESNRDFIHNFTLKLSNRMQTQCNYKNAKKKESSAVLAMAAGAPNIPL